MATAFKLIPQTPASNWASPALEALYRAVEAERDSLWNIPSEEERRDALDTLMEATEALDTAIEKAGWLSHMAGSLDRRARA
jgi:hypothetical protein